VWQVRQRTKHALYESCSCRAEVLWVVPCLVPAHLARPVWPSITFSHVVMSSSYFIHVHTKTTAYEPQPQLRWSTHSRCWLRRAMTLRSSASVANGGNIRRHPQTLQLAIGDGVPETQTMSRRSPPARLARSSQM
jgi:hypothetical protein